jgi:hypothetical protein
MDLVQIIDKKAIIREDLALIPEFKTLYTKNKKDVADKYVSYIYFLCDFKSPYNSYTDEDKERHCKEDFLGDLPETVELKEAIRKYNEFQDTVSMRFLKAAKSGCEKIIEFCNTVDLNERDKTNRPIYKAKEFAETLKQVAAIKQNLEQLEEAVKRDQIQGRTKGGKAISRRED